MSSAAFLPARAKLCIASLDDPELQVRAQYNPKELQYDKSLTWEDHKSRNNQTEGPRGGRRKQPQKPRQDNSNQDDLEFKQAAPRTMSVELLFDGYEVGESVEPDVIALETLASVERPQGEGQEEKRRPHHCVIVWGASQGGMRPFRCVIESLSVKYTMWDHGGMPMRATCTVKVKECQKMKGSQPPQKEYAEMRRDPRWERSSEPPPRNVEAERYQQQMADRRDRMGREP